MNYYMPQNLRAWEDGLLNSSHLDPDTAISLYNDIARNPKIWYRPSEMAELIGRTSQYVRDAFDNQQILGHTSKGGGTGQRRNYLIHKRSILLYLLETANYTGADLVGRLKQLVKHCTPEQRLKLVEAITPKRQAG